MAHGVTWQSLQQNHGGMLFNYGAHYVDQLLCLYRAIGLVHSLAAATAGVDTTAIGADSLMPLLVWTVAHASMPHAFTALEYAKQLSTNEQVLFACLKALASRPRIAPSHRAFASRLRIAFACLRIAFTLPSHAFACLRMPSHAFALMPKANRSRPCASHDASGHAFTQFTASLLARVREAADYLGARLLPCLPRGGMCVRARLR